jgi:Tfp pilus assembly protein PilN
MNSINLLPPDIKATLDQKKKNVLVLGVLYKSVWILAFVVGIITATWFFLEANAKNVDLELAKKNEEISSFGTLENQAKKVADKISSIKKIEGNLNSWESLITEMQKAMPSNTYLSKLSISSDGKVRASIAGLSKSKTNIASLRNALEESKYFEYVDIENASTDIDPKTGVDIENFSLSFSLEKGALDE